MPKHVATTNAGSTSDVPILQSDGTVQWGAQGGGVTDHGALTGLTDDDHSQYHNDARALTWLGMRTTTDLPEGTNLYYTDTRFDTRFGTKTTTNLSEGSNLYFTNTRADARIAAAVIDDISNVNTAGASNGQVLKFNGSTWTAQNDDVGSGSLPGGARSNVLRHNGTAWYASNDVFNVLDYGADRTGASNATAAIQSAIDDAEAAKGGVVYLPAGNYRIDTGLSISDASVHIKGAGHSAWGVSGSDGAGATGVNHGSTMIVSNQAIHMLTIDNGGGNDWRGALVEDLHFLDYSASHNQVLSAVRIRERHGSVIRNVSVSLLEGTGAVAFLIDPTSANSAQYTQFIYCRTEDVFCALKTTGNAPDTELYGCFFYGYDDSSGPIGATIGLDLVTNSLRMMGGAIQFFNKHVYIDGTSGLGEGNKFYNVAIEVQSSWTGGAGTAGFHITGSSAKNNVIDGCDFANISGMGSMIIIDSGVTYTMLHNVYQPGSTLVVTDNGSHTMMTGSPQHAVRSISSTTTLDGTYRVVLVTSSSADVNLPQASRGNGRRYVIRNTSAGSVDINPNGADTIDGSSTAVTLAAGESAGIVGNGSAWFTV